MLLCSVDDLEPGMVVGASVLHPKRPEMELLRPGAPLDPATILQLHRLGVVEVWVHHDLTRDLDDAAAPSLAAAHHAVYRRIRDDFTALAGAAVTTAQVQSYREVVSGLILELARNGAYAALGARMLDDESGLFTHGANVAYLALLAALEMQTYIVRERSRLAPEHARDMIPLGIGALMHDVGKVALEGEARHRHEIYLSGDAPLDEYRRHVAEGYEMLAETRLPASARQVVLNHHQRFDGGGWPDDAAISRRRADGAPDGGQIHVFSRIVAAANVLDNLTRTRDGARRPTVAALRDFTGTRFDGWFDPVVRDLLARKLPPFPIGAMVRLSNRRQAVVVAPNLHQPCRPLVRYLDDGSPPAGETVDLDAERRLQIAECGGQSVRQYLFDLPDRRRHVAAEAPAAA
jgi:HD-GYP domain-containing protein (c-di-GMP phosphodiesterase class II)